MRGRRSRPGASLAERLEDRIERADGCWRWTGVLTNGGYGVLPIYDGHGGRRFVTAHRLVYEYLVGPIPDGLVVDHLCRNRACVNPDHLEPVTFTENIIRGVGPTAINAAKTHCIHGHPFDDTNTYFRGNHPNRRDCRACIRRRIALSHEKRRKAA